MDRNVLLFLLLVVVTVTLSKYIYIQKRLWWPEAQRHCRSYYTDLAPVSNKYDAKCLHKLSGNSTFPIWIGLMRDPADRGRWMWSGGGEVSRFFWENGQPDDYLQVEDYGVIQEYTWHDAPAIFALPFFCYKVHAVREKKTWEEALRYCRKNHRDLASVASETEMMLIQKELSKDYSTEHVWIGFRFLAGDWMWVDRQRSRYEAWGLGGKPWCPDGEMLCGALEVMGPMQPIRTNAVWKNCNCSERLHFLCY